MAGLLSIFALQPGVQLGAADKVAVSAYSLGFYLWKTILPTHLAPLYERRLPIPILSPVFIACYALAIAFVGAAWICRRRFPGLTAAFVAFTAARAGRADMAAISTAADTLSIGFILVSVGHCAAAGVHQRPPASAAPASGISLPRRGAISRGSGNVFDIITPPLRHFEPLQK